MLASISSLLEGVVPYLHTIELIGGAVISFLGMFFLAVVDFVQKGSADEFSNFRNPITHFKSVIWFTLIGIVGFIFYLVSFTTDNTFIQAITWGAPQPLIRGFAIAGMVTAILRSTLTAYKDSQVGFDGLYAFVQKRFISAWRRDSDLLRLQLYDSFKGKFRGDADFPSFLNTIVDSEHRALSFSEPRRKELRDQYDAARRLLEAVAPNELDNRSAIYDSMISVAFSFCPIGHLKKSLQSRVKFLDRQMRRAQRTATTT